MEFSEKIQTFLKEEYDNADVDAMSLDELKQFLVDVSQKREEYAARELAYKLSGNAAYGASANPAFPFFNVNLAADITGECRELTKFMWNRLERFFHEDIWERKDLWKQFDFALDESKKKWYIQQAVSVYSDTDSVYTTYGKFFECFTEEAKKKYDTDLKKVEWILKFNQDFLDKQNTEWLNDMYTPRHAKNAHLFELETISKVTINLKKKKYIKALSFNKGKFLDPPKISGTGIEIIKSTTPALCRDILKDLTNDLMFNYNEKNKEEYVFYFNDKLAQWKKKFYAAPIEDISQSVGIGAYKKYVIDDTDALVFAPKAPVSVKCAARYNYLAHKAGKDNLRMMSGKIKYYNISIGKKQTDYFGFPSGEFPADFAPPIDYQTQWTKTVIEPINRFLEVMNIPLVNASGTIQMNLFGF